MRLKEVLQIKGTYVVNPTILTLSVPRGTEGLNEGDIITFGKGTKVRIGPGLFSQVDPRQQFRVHVEDGLSILDKGETAWMK